MKIYMHLNGEEFDKAKLKANKEAKEDDENSKDYYFNDLVLETDEIDFSDGKLYLSGTNELGYFQLASELDLDTVVDIIEFYMKKLGKLKTILEATK